MIALDLSDFQFVGLVAKHCDTRKLQIAINHAIQQDLKPLLCNLYGLIGQHWQDPDGTADPEIYAAINGGDYQNCQGYTVHQVGLRQVLSYYAYARYMMLNSIDDTPNGAVTKNSEWSIPVPLTDRERVSDQYRNMGRSLYKEVEAYLYMNREHFPGYCYEDFDCSCNGCCGATTRNKGYGINSKTISKHELSGLDERLRHRLWPGGE